MPAVTVHADDVTYEADCTVTVTSGHVPLKQLAVTSSGTTATCVASTLAAADSTTCSFTQQLPEAEVIAGSSTITITAAAAPDVASSASISDVAATGNVSQTRTACLSIVHVAPETTVTTMGEWLPADP